MYFFTLGQKRLFSFALVFGLLFCLMPFTEGAHARPKSDEQTVLKDMVLGQKNAKKTLIVYASTSCSHCAHWYHDILPHLQKNYISQGKLKIIWREVATSPEPYALASYVIGRCLAEKQPNASNEVYFKIMSAFFDAQKDFFDSLTLEPAITQSIKKTGLSKDEIISCLADGSLKDDIITSMSLHTAHDKIVQTPSFILDGNRINAATTDDFDRLLK